MNQNIKNYLGLASAMVSALNAALLGYAAAPSTSEIVPLTVSVIVAVIAAMLAAGVVFVNNLPIERTVRTVTESPEGDKVTETVTEKAKPQ